MELKEQIEVLLVNLKKEGWERSAIEKELNYSENYIDQVLAKGGNLRFLGALEKFSKDVLQKATPQHRENSSLNPSETILEGPTNATLQDYIDILQQNDKFFKDTFASFASNLSNLTANLTALVTMVSAGHRIESAYHDVMLQSLARLEKRPENSLIEVAHNNDAVEQDRELDRGMKKDKSKLNKA
ncbi:hypothetical protein [Paraflavitalea sp. CAU 1676]|uniref:hypothetical protein n=1 Tax=Paraflavitalea sp. CAU 1676 TaxID=3032598 RepID=UPI0023DB6574|nr:hypothetical protein [Paraflavitalea sp. CAU 1676]MDF2189329.1 hypothetical protein [Paraflavitalea sp. CAU 1676]